MQLHQKLSEVSPGIIIVRSSFVPYVCYYLQTVNHTAIHETVAKACRIQTGWRSIDEIGSVTYQLSALLGLYYIFHKICNV